MSSKKFHHPRMADSQSCQIIPSNPPSKKPFHIPKKKKTETPPPKKKTIKWTHCTIKKRLSSNQKKLHFFHNQQKWHVFFVQQKWFCREKNASKILSLLRHGFLGFLRLELLKGLLPLRVGEEILGVAIPQPRLEGAQRRLPSRWTPFISDFVGTRS